MTLWAFSEVEGKKHFDLLCASCHQLNGEGNRIGPELTGAGANGVRYFIENIVDPNAVIGNDYQMIMVETRDGELVSGILERETEDALTIRTTTDSVLVSKREILERTLAAQSMMPEGLILPLNERQQIELLKFLTRN